MGAEAVNSEFYRQSMAESKVCMSLGLPRTFDDAGASNTYFQSPASESEPATELGKTQVRSCQGPDRCILSLCIMLRACPSGSGAQKQHVFASRLCRLLVPDPAAGDFELWERDRVRTSEG